MTWLSHRRVVGLVNDEAAESSTPPVPLHLAPLVVGADGRRSTVARLVAAPTQREHTVARLLVYRYLIVYDGPGEQVGAEFSLRGNEMAYAFPSDQGVTCLAVTVPIDQAPTAYADLEGFFEARLAGHRGLWSRYAASQKLGRIVAGRPSDDYVRQAAGPGWALVGDAGTHQDPWSGLGMDTRRPPGPCPGRRRDLRRAPTGTSGTPRHGTRSRSRATRRRSWAPTTCAASSRQPHGQVSKRSSSTCGGRSAGRGPE